jgi:ABC-type glycerol-3-phosphate transport system permease component
MSGSTGATINNKEIKCYDDIDCPAAGICGINQTWAARPGGWCMCPTKLGLSGEGCREWCATGYVIFVFCLVTLTSTLVVCAVSSFVLYKKLKVEKRGIFSPDTLTLQFSSAGLLCFLVVTVLELCRTIGFPYFFVIGQSDTGRKIRRISQQVEFAASATYGLAFCLSKCTLIVLPLTWIDVAKRSNALQEVQARRTIRLSLLAFVMIVVVELPMNIIEAGYYNAESPPWTIASIIIWGTICALTVVLTLTAGYKVSRVRKQYDSRASESQKRISNALTRIQRTSLQLVTADLVTLVFMIIGSFRTRRTLYSDPKCYVDYTDVVFRMSILISIYMSHIAVKYLAKWGKPRPTGGDRDQS